MANRYESLAEPTLRPAVVLFVDDLFFSARLADAITAQKGTAVTVDTREAFLQAMDASLPVLALVDLHVSADWASAIQSCKLRPHTRSIPIYGFGQHTDVPTLTRARESGADQAWARSRMMEELPRLLANHIRPAPLMPEGGEEAMPELVREGIRLFNNQQFHAQHEAFEEAWIQEARPVRDLYQGLLQVGLAFYQIQARNRAGAIKMFGRGIPRLRNLPVVVQGIQVQRFVTEALTIFEQLTPDPDVETWDRLFSCLPLIRTVTIDVDEERAAE